ncbi:ATP-binding protein [Methylocystis sp. S23]
MNCLSLRAGLSWLIGLVLVSTLLINLFIQLLHAAPRVRAEAGSNLRLMREFVLATIANLPANEDPTPKLRRLFASLGDLRHVDIVILSANEEAPAPWAGLAHAGERDVPAWFVRLVGASPRIVIAPVTMGDRVYGRVAIISNPLDELEEIWSDMTWLASISLSVTLAILILVLVLVRFSLAPFDALHAGLADLEGGRRGVRIAPRGAREFRRISNALNSLAATLDRVKDENRQLMNELIEIQDNERKEIARDLHDEAGPCLFSIRASAAALQEALSSPAPDFGRLRRLSAIMDKASEALQSLFRGLLGRLRPPGLDELGLESALKALLASWEFRHPEVSLRLILPRGLSSLDEATSFAAYRIVQEGVTNIFRHADADRGEVRLEFGWESGRGAAEDESDAPKLKITITDNGVGIPDARGAGVGLLGMSERARALGGTIEIERCAAGGTRISASLPLRDDEESLSAAPRE